MRIVLVGLLGLVVGCQRHARELVVSRAKDVPALWVLAGDSLLTWHQDTLYHNGQKFSGRIYLLSKSSDTLLTAPYLHGLCEGNAKKWYPNGQLMEDRLYVRGTKEGTHRGWWEDGKLQYEFTISNDEYTGEFREWNSEGRLIKMFHYKDGHEEGSQQLWYDDGKVRANYVVANGRRFGLLGTKNCINVSDSVFRK